MIGFGYLETGIGNYRINDTVATTSGERNDTFYNARAGGGLNYMLGNDWSLDGTLDYRYRYYDNADSRHDSDLRWNGAASRNIGESNLVLGARGRVSYRGNGQDRNDYGVYGDWNDRLDADNQVSAGATVWRRQYPSGPLSNRSRTVGEITVGWLRSLDDGRASLEIKGRGGYNWGTSRHYGDSSQYGAEATLDFTVTDSVGGFVFGWWEHDAFNVDRIRLHPDSVDDSAVGARRDNLYEVGGGLVWGFAPKWSLRPEILWIRDQSNVFVHNYSSTEVWLNLRYAF